MRGKAARSAGALYTLPPRPLREEIVKKLARSVHQHLEGRTMGLGEELYDHIRGCEEVENRSIVEEEVDDAIFNCI